MSLDQESTFVIEDSNRIIKSWNCSNDNLFSPYKIQLVYNLRKNNQIVTLDHQVMSHCGNGFRTLATSNNSSS